MKIQIWVRDFEISDKNEKNENLGIDTKEKEYSLTTLTFDKRKLSSFWIDSTESIDGETQSRDIAFYVDGYYFRTPYDLLKEKGFEQIIKENEQV